MPTVLGIGSPKSGTHYASAVLRAVGVRALHEQIGQGGTISPWLTVSDWWHPAASRCGLRSDLSPDVVIHVVRHPIDVIASLCAFDHPAFWQWQERHTGIEIAERTPEACARFWIAFVQKANAQTTKVWRVEDTASKSQWDEIARWTGVDAECPDVPLRAAWETPGRKPIVWSDLGYAEYAVRITAEALGY